MGRAPGRSNQGIGGLHLWVGAPGNDTLAGTPPKRTRCRDQRVLQRLGSGADRKREKGGGQERAPVPQNHLAHPSAPNRPQAGSFTSNAFQAVKPFSSPEISSRSITGRTPPAAQSPAARAPCRRRRSARSRPCWCGYRPAPCRHRFRAGSPGSRDSHSLARDCQAGRRA